MTAVKVETYCVHSPDPDTPIEETVDAMQLVYTSGKFKHVGNTRFPGDQGSKAYMSQSSVFLILRRRTSGRYTTMQNQRVTFYRPSTKETITPSPVTTTEPSSLSFESSVSLSTPIPPSPVVSSSKTLKFSKQALARAAGIPVHRSEKCIMIYTTDRRCSKHYRNGKRLLRKRECPRRCWLIDG